MEILMFWSFWLSGVMLASVPLAHWLVLRRAFAVSGRFTALVDAFRFRSEAAPEPEPGGDVDQAALLAALRAQTEALMGPDVLEELPVEPFLPAPRGLPQSNFAHGLFLLGLTLGGALGAWSMGRWQVSAGLRSLEFDKLVSALHVPGPVLLVLGGMLVGAGTRMAGGCTSGHGLCGVSQLQPGSLLATASFFGAAVAISFALGALL
jgi:uncharacterized membrane protein YedE/YeeE